MKLRRGDLVWLSRDLNINLGDNVQDIDRPFVIISNNINNEKCPTVNIACLSKQVSKANYPMHVFIKKDKYNLDYDGVIYTEQVLTVNKNKVREKIGSLDKNDLEKLNGAIYTQLIDERRIGFSR